MARLIMVAAVAVFGSACAASSTSCLPGNYSNGVCYHNPVSYRQIPNSSFEECCSYCQEDANCLGFVLNGKSCNLKNAIMGTPSHNAECQAVSGIRAPTTTTTASPPKGAKNILFLVADDMRPSLGSYGHKASVTPNMDRLAREGLQFQHTYVQFAYCAPSRNSFMSGRRPDATKTWNFLDHFREGQVGANWTALPEHFKLNGYLTTGTGKLFHPGVPPNYDEPRSWSATAPDGTPWPFFNTHGETGRNACADKCCGANDTAHYCLWDLSDNATLEDMVNNNEAKNRLKTAIHNYKATGQPFFVGQGYHRPHLPWIVPKQFYDNVPLDLIVEAKHQAWPSDKPGLHFHDCAEMSHAYWNDKGQGVPLTEGEYFASHQAEMRRAYYAAISYIDSLMGELLQVLDDEGVADDTIVSITSDHGWHVGEFDMWCKMSNLELGTRTPLIIRAPFMTNSSGKTTAALSELVDLYPTLSDLAGLSLPASNDGGEYLGGQSLKPVFEDPSSTVKSVALSQFPRCWQNNTHHPAGDKVGDENNHTNSWVSMSDCHWTNRTGFDYMGYRMRTDDYAITQWVVWNRTSLRPEWEQTVGLELYDHRTDDGMAPAAFDDFEVENLAYDSNHQELLKQLLDQLHSEVKQWFTPNPPLP
eukprot:TRINITY_DN5658_c0_g2_i1.p1 TRINITY_DN5658_c0_g2~~TRINITY_DN5658_c0_g2_i1.p1  ORF type:complete len:644 (+),score=152.35 TRINITY_DN5658_c0_g2_i1:27-1958(+)